MHVYPTAKAAYDYCEFRARQFCKSIGKLYQGIGKWTEEETGAEVVTLTTSSEFCLLVIETTEGYIVEDN